MLLLLVAAIAPVIYAVSRTPTVEAKNFTVKDGDGNFRAELALERGEPVLILADKHGIPRAVYGTGDDGESVLGFYSNRTVRARLFAKPDGPAQLTFQDTKGEVSR